jgi:uncharacterized protein
LKTGLCIVTKRLDTGSPWILTNSPAAPFWETPKPDPNTGEPEYIGNRYYKLSNLVRASTAAPHFFDPELLPITTGNDPLPHIVAAPFDQPFFVRVIQAALETLGLRTPVDKLRGYGMFIDGGVTPYNNPSLALLLVATLRPFGLTWKLGPDQLTMVSIGTGTFRAGMSYSSLRFFGFPKLAYHALMSVISDAQLLMLAQMQWLGACASPWKINSELKKMIGDGPAVGKLFRFSRYDIRLERDWIGDKLGMRLSSRSIDRLRDMSDPSNVGLLYKLAKIAAKHQVREKDWNLPPRRSKAAKLPRSSSGRA